MISWLEYVEGDDPDQECIEFIATGWKLDIVQRQVGYKLDCIDR